MRRRRKHRLRLSTVDAMRNENAIFVDTHKSLFAADAIPSQVADAILRDQFSDRQSVHDNYVNPVLKLGLGTDNAMTASGYSFNPITRNRLLLEWIHRGSWLGGMAVDIIADDMTRGGIEIKANLKPNQIERLYEVQRSTDVWGGINEALKWGRLYGGALGVYLVDGQNPKSPLRMDAVGKGQFKGIAAIDRWSLEPLLTDLVTAFGPDVGMPRYYRVSTDSAVYPGKILHYSRVFRALGVKLPYRQAIMEQLWGLSVVERIYDRMTSFDAATAGVSQLIHKMFLRTYKIQGLRELAGSNIAAMQGLQRYVEFMRLLQSNEGITLIDAKDDIAAVQQTVSSGVPEVLMQLGQQLSGALQIPLVRLFGQSPGGLSSSGESDLRTYYDGIRRQQVAQLRPAIVTTLQLTALSEGIKLPEGWSFEFNSLWQMSEEQRATNGKAITETVLSAETAGVVDRATALRELRSKQVATGLWSHITDEMIEEAENDPVPSMEEAMAGMGGALRQRKALPAPTAVGQAASKPAKQPAAQAGESKPKVTDSIVFLRRA